LITIFAMIKPTAPLTQFAPFRLIPGWKYASRSGSYLVGQGSDLQLAAQTATLKGFSGIPGRFSFSHKYSRI